MADNETSYSYPLIEKSLMVSDETKAQIVTIFDIINNILNIAIGVGIFVIAVILMFWFFTRHDDNHPFKIKMRENIKKFEKLKKSE